MRVCSFGKAGLLLALMLSAVATQAQGVAGSSVGSDALQEALEANRQAVARAIWDKDKAAAYRQLTLTLLGASQYEAAMTASKQEIAAQARFAALNAGNEQIQLDLVAALLRLADAAEGDLLRAPTRVAADRQTAATAYVTAAGHLQKMLQAMPTSSNVQDMCWRVLRRQSDFLAEQIGVGRISDGLPAIEYPYLVDAEQATFEEQLKQASRELLRLAKLPGTSAARQAEASYYAGVATALRYLDAKAAIELLADALIYYVQQTAGKQAATATSIDPWVKLARVHRANSVFSLANYSEAKQRLSLAKKHDQEAAQTLPNSYVHWRALADDLLRRADAEKKLKQFAEAQADVQEAIAIVRRFHQRDAANPQTATDFYRALITQARLCITTKDMVCARQYQQQAADIARMVDSQQLRVVPLGVDAALVAGRIAEQAGDKAAAADHYLAALSVLDARLAMLPDARGLHSNRLGVLESLITVGQPGYDWNMIVAQYNLMAQRKLLNRSDEEWRAAAIARASGRTPPEPRDD